MLLYQWLTECTNRHGVAKALIYRDSYLSWRGLLDRVDRRAQELTALGVVSGDWVGLMLGNVPDLVILALAVSKLNATMVPIDPTTGVRELQLLLEVFPLRALITRPRGGTDPGVVPSTLMRSRAVSAKEWQAETKSQPSHIQPELRKRLQGTLITCLLYKREQQKPAATPLVFVTHDAKGMPKGVCRTNEQLTAHTDLLRIALELQQTDRVFSILPLYVAYNFECGFLLSLRFGMPLYLEEEMTPMRVSKLLKEQAITLFPGNPWIYASLNRIVTTLPKITTPRARFLSSGMPLPSTVADAFAKRFGVRPRSLYYTVESGSLCLEPEATSGNGVHVGLPLPSVKVRLLPDRQQPDKNAVWIQSPAMSVQAISHLGVASQQSVQMGDQDADGWMYTGDQGQWDAKGRLTLLGRADDLVKVNHKRVRLDEVKACLMSHPKVKNVKMRLEIDAEMNPILIALVNRKGACSEDTLLEHCARHLPPYKTPRKIEFFTE